MEHYFREEALRTAMQLNKQRTDDNGQCKDAEGIIADARLFEAYLT